MTPTEQARADAMADAETLRWAVQGVGGGPLVDASLQGGRAVRAVLKIDSGNDGGCHNPIQAAAWAESAARAAFRAVPGLRGDQ
jgi:hypothetical protein